jgi:hypothetical protein
MGCVSREFAVLRTAGSFLQGRHVGRCCCIPGSRESGGPLFVVGATRVMFVALAAAACHPWKSCALLACPWSQFSEWPSGAGSVDFGSRSLLRAVTRLCVRVVRCHGEELPLSALFARAEGGFCRRGPCQQ